MKYNHIRIKLYNGIQGVILGTTNVHQHNSTFSVALMETGHFIYFDSADCQQGILELIDDVPMYAATDEFNDSMNKIAQKLFDESDAVYVQTYIEYGNQLHREHCHGGVNPEADEINEEDLEAAAEMYDKVFPKWNGEDPRD